MGWLDYQWLSEYVLRIIVRRVNLTLIGNLVQDIFQEEFTISSESFWSDCQAAFELVYREVYCGGA